MTVPSALGSPVRELRNGGDAPAAADAPRRPRLFESGVLAIVVGAPLAFLPMSAGPFVDVKVVVVLAGALAIWAGAPRADRALSTGAAAWVGVTAVAGIVGVDRWWALAGVENLGTGLMLLGPCAYLLVAGSSIPASLARRIPRWLLAVGVAVSAIAVVWRFAPGAVEAVVPDLSFEGSTLGHAVLLSGGCTLALVAAVAIRPRRPVLFVAAVAIVASGLSLSTKRAGWVALLVGLAVAWWRAKADRGAVVRVAVVVVVVLGGWTAIDLSVAPAQGVSAAGRFGELTTDSARSRIVIHAVLARAWLERPVLGWGPGATWGAYLATASPDEVEIAHRGVADAHDLVLGIAVTSGVAGLGAFAALAWAVGRRARRARADLSWAVAATVAMLVFHLLQPVSAPLTPLAFLVVGIASGGGAPAPHAGRSAGRSVVGVLLALGLMLSLLVLASSVLEQWGRTYNSQWSLRMAHALAPGRVTPVETLALYRAQDAGRDPDAAVEARGLVAELVREHPAHPGVRMIGLRVELLLDDPVRARTWLERQVEAFPGDVGSFPPAMLGFLRGGELPGPFVGLQSAVGTADETR